MDPLDCKIHMLPNSARLFSTSEFKVEVIQFLPAAKGQPTYFGYKNIELNRFCVTHWQQL